MQDPSYGVAQPLQNHMHLICSHPYPHLPNLGIEQALRYLAGAPTIVEGSSPMSWRYMTTPPDGTMWLEWISPRHNAQNRFPSDGYVWGDPEQTYKQEFGGYTIEWMTHTIGYRPQQDHTATHARTRFHLVAKNPSVNAPSPDPSLWIVHYHQTDPQRMMPAAQIPISPLMRQQLAERRYLEMQGRIETKDFMLRDRDRWPTVTLPPNAAAQLQQQQMMQQQQQQAMYANPAMMQQQQMSAAAGVPRFPQQQFPQQNQAPPAKRARHTGPNTMPGAPEVGQEHAIDDEESALLDWFDYLTPRDISKVRYIQHHEWMEEVFNSPYASSSIVPPDLGLGLMGELKGLTEGILNPPSFEDTKRVETRYFDSTRPEKYPRPNEAQPFTNLKKEQMDEFNRRVEKHLADGTAEIERMKKEHAEKMAEWKRSKALLHAEKRLRYATWEGHEDAVPLVYRLDVPPANGHSEENVKQETVEDVMKEVEGLLGAKIRAHSDATMVKRGGLEEQEEEKLQLLDDVEMAADAPSLPVSTAAGLTNGAPSADQSNAQQAALSGGVQLPVQGHNVSTTLPQHPVGEDSLEQTEDPLDSLDDGFVMVENEGEDGLGDVDEMDVMDMDVDTGDIDFVQHDDDEFGNTPMAGSVADVESVPAPVDEPVVAALAAAPPTTAEAVSEPLLAVEEAAPVSAAAEPVEEGQQQQQQQLELPPHAEESAVPALAAEASLGNEPDVSASVVDPPASAAAAAPATIDPAASAAVVEDIEADIAAAAADDNSDIFGDGTFDGIPEDDADGNDLDFGTNMDTAFGDAMHGLEQTDTPDLMAGGDAEGEGEGGDGAVGESVAANDLAGEAPAAGQEAS